jgi:hypothetical protein
VRFELTKAFAFPVFKTGAFNRSATPPSKQQSEVSDQMIGRSPDYSSFGALLHCGQHGSASPKTIGRAKALPA